MTVYFCPFSTPIDASSWPGHWKMFVVFFLLDLLTDEIRLVYHEAWISLLLILLAMIFRASARANPSDGLQKYIAFWFAALAFDRVLLVGAAAFRLYHPWLVGPWIRVIHFGLFILEFSIVITAFYLLNKPIRARLKSLLKGWLDD